MKEHYQTAISLTALLLLAVIVVPGHVGAQITSNVLRRTLLVRVPDENQGSLEYGTAFTIDIDGRQYLITAKHVVVGLRENSDGKIQILKKAGWSDLRVHVYKCDDPVDIAVLVPPSQLTVSYPLEPSSVGIAVGQDVFFVGFPNAAEFAKIYGSLPDVFGLVNRGTLAQLDSIPERKAQRLFVDGYNVPGLSGSPIVFRDIRESGLNFKLAGVVVAYEAEPSPVFNKTEIQQKDITARDRADGNIVSEGGRIYRLEESGQVVKQNMGIAVGWDIHSAVDLIRRHPIGPKTDEQFQGVSQLSLKP